MPALLDEQLAIVKSASGARREGGENRCALFFGHRVEDRQTKIRDRQTDRQITVGRFIIAVHRAYVCLGWV